MGDEWGTSTATLPIGSLLPARALGGSGSRPRLVVVKAKRSVALARAASRRWPCPVAQWLPDYEQRRARLRELGPNLVW